MNPAGLRPVRPLMPFRQLTLAVILCLLGGCFPHIPVDQVQLAAFRRTRGHLRLEFTTSHGRQVAYYLPPLLHPEAPPARLCILYPGIASQALDWLRFIHPQEAPDVGWLLIDYPGRGECEGTMNPADNYLNSEGALAVLAKNFGVRRLHSAIALLGHSFGCGAALKFAVLHQVVRIVLVAPYDTLRDAVAQRSWLLSVIMPAQVDSRKLIRELLASPEPPAITILHGAKDTTLPVRMGRTLAAIDPQRITFEEFPDDDHVSILTNHRDLIFRTLLGNWRDFGLKAASLPPPPAATGSIP